MAKLEWENKKSFFGKLKGTLEKQKAAAHAGTKAATQQTAEKALDMTPRDTGALQDSQRVEDMTSSKNEVVFEISYNKNGNAPYAIDQHEITTFRHGGSRNPPAAQHHFLQKAIFENRARKFRLIAEKVNFERLE